MENEVETGMVARSTGIRISSDWGRRLGGPHEEDQNDLGSMLGSPYLWGPNLSYSRHVIQNPIDMEILSGTI